jgi:Domain of unknown function (DUF4347)
MPAETNTAPTALGGTNNSPDEPASNRAGQDLAMPRTLRHSRETCPGPRPGSGKPEPAPGLNRGPPAQASEKLSDTLRTPRHSRAPSVIPAEAGTQSLPLAGTGAPGVQSVASCSSPGQVLDPHPRGGDGQPADDRDRTRELLFVDPGVSDIETLLGHLRPEVEAILLDPFRPPARQMAAAVAGRHDLDAVHVIAHGAPGRVSFTAGGWSAATLEDEAEDLAAIGQALGAGRNVNLWSCQTAAGPAGAAFIAGLAQAAGADIAAASGLVGAAALGGGWELASLVGACVARAPLTDAGVAGYAGVFSVTLTSRGQRERLTIFGSWLAGTKAGTYFIVWNNSGALEVLGQFIVPVGLAGTFVISEPLPAGTYTLGPATPGPGTIAVYNGKWNETGPAAGTWSVSDFNPTLTATLNNTSSIASNRPIFSGAVR